MRPELPLAGKRVAILLDDLYEDAELTVPREVLTRAGAQVILIGAFAGRTYTGKKGDCATSDRAAAGSQAAEFDALVIPGGYAPDKMRLIHPMLDLVRDVMRAGKPVAAICHGPQVLINANVLRGRTLTCWPSIAVDVKNAGGRYVDKPVVEDGNLITARKVDDLNHFTDALVRQLTN
ncbi:MAG: type 1 glutamine amidotransferase domain-containing protein [Vicinamibacterales bacterium]